MRIVSPVLGAATFVVGLSTSPALAIPALLPTGAAWVLALSMFNTVVQLSALSWMVGRAMAAIQIVIFGGFAAGGLSYGALAQVRGVPFALAISGIGLAGSTLLGLCLPVATPDTAGSVSPAQTGATDGCPVEPRRWPVVTTVQYRVAKKQASECVSRNWELSVIRRKNDARRWAILGDLSDPDVRIERFESVTWLDHLRRSDRVMAAKAEFAKRIFALHQGSGLPRIKDFLERSPGSFDEGANLPTQEGGREALIDPGLPSTFIQPAVRLSRRNPPLCAKRFSDDGCSASKGAY